MRICLNCNKPYIFVKTKTTPDKKVIIDTYTCGCYKNGKKQETIEIRLNEKNRRY